MRPLIMAVLALEASVGSLCAEDLRHIDVHNLFPNVGLSVVWADANNAGVPPGVLGACSGTLIQERVFLTAGHCTRISEGGIPPFIRVFVTFNLHVFDDRSTRNPVIAQAWHPSTLPCPNNSLPGPLHLWQVCPMSASCSSPNRSVSPNLQSLHALKRLNAEEGSGKIRSSWAMASQIQPLRGRASPMVSVGREPPLPRDFA